MATAPSWCCRTASAARSPSTSALRGRSPGEPSPRGGAPSFAAVFSAGFTPGIQFGFGFQLSRVGGVVGINRSVDEHAIATRLRDGSAGEVLFPLDVGASALRALAALEAILPPRAGDSVVGPTLRMSWLEIGGQGFLSLDLGVLIELPGPQRIVIVGIARPASRRC